MMFKRENDEKDVTNSIVGSGIFIHSFTINVPNPTTTTKWRSWNGR
jgi:hypothetical protein